MTGCAQLNLKMLLKEMAHVDEFGVIQPEPQLPDGSSNIGQKGNQEQQEKRKGKSPSNIK
jgi:hypothetical protein